MPFAVLPDHDHAAGLLPAVRALTGRRVVPHASGRPWLVGTWDDHLATIHHDGPLRVAVLGVTRHDPRLLAELTATIRDVDDLDAVASRLPGCHHLVASVDGIIRCQGSLSTARQIFVADVDGVNVASDDPGVLRDLTQAPLDPAAVASRLLAPMGAPWPLLEASVWSGVDAVGSGQWVRLDRTGPARFHRWWRPPTADLTLAECGPLLRDALREALDLRATVGPLSADLSGGIDSTALCFLAAATGQDLTTFHVRPLDAGNSDTPWARRAAAALPGVRHVELDSDRAGDLTGSGDDDEAADGRALTQADAQGPSPWAAGRRHVLDISARSRDAGALTHLVGLGGDELFGSFPSLLWSLVRDAPLLGLRVANRQRLLNRWSLSATLGALRDSGDLPSSLRHTAADLQAPGPASNAFDASWTGAVRLPPWATDHAANVLAERLRHLAATGLEPLDDDRSRHHMLASVVFEGTTMRHVGAAVGRDGPRWEAPLLDRPVVEAALRLRPRARLAPGKVKPLLGEALHGIVPDEFLGRRDKGEFTAELYRDLARQREHLARLCATSPLGRLGLVDADVLRHALTTSNPLSDDLAGVEQTVAVEGWLRRLPAAAWSPALSRV